MKLVRYSVRGSSPRLGALVGDRIRCLGETYHRYLAGRGVVRAGELAHALFPPSAREFLRAGAAAEDALRTMDDAVRAGRLEWHTHPAAEAHLHAPIHDPEKFLCIGLNYIDHAEETKSPIPKEPPLFAKFPNAIVDAAAPIVRPKGCEKLDYEVELGFVMGREARDVPAERALDYIWGYVVVNDVSARDFQMVTSQWMAGKACDTLRAHGSLDRRPDRGPRPPRPRAPHLGERDQAPGRALEEPHLQHQLPRRVPVREDDPPSRRPRHHGDPRRRGLHAKAAGPPQGR